MVRAVRLLVRHLHFLSMLLDGVLDELVYQLEFAIRDALPPQMDLQHAPRAAWHLLSHLLSAMTGATISILTSRWVARPVPVAAP